MDSIDHLSLGTRLRDIGRGEGATVSRVQTWHNHHEPVRALSVAMGGPMHCRRRRTRTFVARAVRNHCKRGDCAGQSAGGRAGMANDYSDAPEDRFRCARPGARALAGRRRHAVHQLGSQAVLDGVAGLAVHRSPVRAVAVVGANPVLYCRPHSAGGGALHGDGVRVVEPVRGRATLHAEPGRAERRHHGVCVRAAGRPAARASPRSPCPGRPADLGGAIYRRAGHRRATVASRAASLGRRHCSGRWMCCSRCRWSRC